MLISRYGQQERHGRPEDKDDEDDDDWYRRGGEVEPHEIHIFRHVVILRRHKPQIRARIGKPPVKFDARKISPASAPSNGPIGVHAGRVTMHKKRQIGGSTDPDLGVDTDADDAAPGQTPGMMSSP
jgi:hypothetical protein